MTLDRLPLLLRTCALFLFFLLRSKGVHSVATASCTILPDGGEVCPSIDLLDGKITIGGLGRIDAGTNDSLMAHPHETFAPTPTPTMDEIKFREEDVNEVFVTNVEHLGEEYNSLLNMEMDTRPLGEDDDGVFMEEDQEFTDDDDFENFHDKAQHIIDSTGRCKDKNRELCAAQVKTGACTSDSSTMHLACPRACLLCPDQHVPGKDQDDNLWRQRALSDGFLPDIEVVMDAESAESAEAACDDDDGRCQFWADNGECENNPSYMLNSCRKACRTCVIPDRSNKEGRSEDVFDIEVEYGTGYLLFVKGEPQRIQGNNEQETRNMVLKTMTYMRDVVMPDRKLDNIRKDCINRHKLCAFWAVLGECEANPSYMTLQCAPSCETCHLIDIATRCPVDSEAKPAFQPGEMDTMFRRIHDGHFDQYSPHFEHTPDEGEKDGLWIVTFDNFVTEDEADRLIALGHDKNYERSLDVGLPKFDGTFDTHLSQSRTSENAWCTDECEKDDITISVLNRIQNVTTVPHGNYESLQILKYTAGQYYKEHHDFIQHQVGRQCGPRVLTFFLYLSDVEEGGGTGFGPLGIEVQPKKGKALLWPSSLDSNPEKIDVRTHHEALPVIKGTKYAANAWIHLYDYQEPNKIGCT